jgi:hypothetical protein
MNTTKVDIAIYEGETLSLDLTDIRDEKGTVVTDLTGWGARLQVRKKAGDTVAVLDLTGAVAATPTRFHFQAQTEGLTVGSYYYDIRLVSNEGFVSYPFAGSFKMTKPVTEVA